MCQYCEKNSDGDFETWTDPEFEDTRAYLDSSDNGTWWLTTSMLNNYPTTICVYHCPWCGRELD